MYMKLFTKAVLALCLGSLLLATGCSSRQPVNLRVHTEPEGAHVVYRQDNLSWIYLGVTPLDVVEVVSDEKFNNSHTFSLKAMRCGYLDQEKEWSGTEFEKEIDQKGSIFWTPRLIKNSD